MLPTVFGSLAACREPLLGSQTLHDHSQLPEIDPLLADVDQHEVSERESTAVSFDDGAMNNCTDHFYWWVFLWLGGWPFLIPWLALSDPSHLHFISTEVLANSIQLDLLSTLRADRSTRSS